MSLLLRFSNVLFLHFEYRKLGATSSIIFKRRQISVRPISKTRQHTPKQSRLINRTTGERKNVYF